ncbi:EthD domain-containing protein [Aestuariicella hydrocarbonica]|uniref:EthD domain-containing protein n=1 Tax=Pseudomaricurvus hydrocarbonicus TaxID=1470433 RepID=A0A9E5MLD8_9GAMM|nr:EthD domain-containing protein [Aestuariicella hydrocarbonica]NHO66862.1 EthD domain-containing protein [Aestuariicella hydrocarbonica]
MFKMLTFLKKRDDLTMEEFKHYYESVHAQIGKQVLQPEVRRYFRRYLTPFDDALASRANGLDYDVVTEIWFDGKADFEVVMARLSQPDIQRLIVEDEEQLFDRSRNQVMLVDEVETEFAGASANV